MRLLRGLMVVAMMAAGCGSASFQARAAAQQWTAIGTTSLPTEAGLGRTHDGVLHVIFVNPQAVHVDLLEHVALAASGSMIGRPTTIVTGWTAINPSVALLVERGGTLRAFFGGLTPGGGPLWTRLATATAPATGTNWSAPVVADASKLTVDTVADAAGIGAGLAGDGTPVEAWGASGPGYNRFHFGVGAAEPDIPFDLFGSVVSPAVATDAKSGQVVLGWFSLDIRNGGLNAQVITPAGTASQSLIAPGSAANHGDHTAITGRIGAGGIFAAYGSGAGPTKVTLWQFGTSAPRVLATGGEIANVNVGPLPGGRLWLLWESDGLFHAACTDPRARMIGAVTDFPRPPKSLSRFFAYDLQGNAFQGILDVFAIAPPNGTVPNTQTLWHTQVRPTCA